MKRVHFTDNYIFNPTHPVTVNLIGAGGTGCRVVSFLASVDTALRALGKPGLFVRVYDPDEVTEANLGRQLFSESDIGLNKAECLVSRMNNFFGYDWTAEARIYPCVTKDLRQNDLANITITCTDNIKSRLNMAEVLKNASAGYNNPYGKPVYWMDFGNSRTTGQVLLGTVGKSLEQPNSKKFKGIGKLKTITEYVNYASVEVDESEPSCSQAEALAKQDLFINPSLAVVGCDILWKLLHNGIIEHHGLYLNLDTLSMNPIPV